MTIKYTTYLANNSIFIVHEMANRYFVAQWIKILDGKHYRSRRGYDVGESILCIIQARGGNKMLNKERQ